MRVVLPAAVLVCAMAAVPVDAQPGAAASRGTTVGQSPLLGGVPGGTLSPTPLTITVYDAITRALEHNLALLNAEARLTDAQGARWTALSDLLPNVSGRLTENRQKVNLAAFGFPLPPGVPSLVGPFNVFDARVSISQPVLDLRALNASRAQNHNIAAARHDIRTARDLVVLVSGNLYLQAVAALGRVESAQAQVETARAIFEQASNLKAAGMAAGIDVLRTEVQLNTERVRLTAARNEFEKTKLQLVRVMGVPPGQAIEVSAELPLIPAPDMTVDQALALAYTSRPDYLAAQERVQAAEAERRAVSAEYLPSVRVNADYGRIGNSPGGAEATYAMAGVVTVPVFNGGRTRGRALQADATLKLRQSERDDLRAGIDMEVRSAFLDLQAGSEQLAVATRARELAAQQLTQARDRFAAGVASNIEVIQAQEAVAAANEQYTSSLFGYNTAKAALARNLGIVEATAHQYLGGGR